MTLNGVIALMLRYFTEFGSFRGTLRKSVRVRCRRNKFALAVSSSDEFFCTNGLPKCVRGSFFKARSAVPAHAVVAVLSSGGELRQLRVNKARRSMTYSVGSISLSHRLPAK